MKEWKKNLQLTVSETCIFIFFGDVFIFRSVKGLIWLDRTTAEMKTRVQLDYLDLI